MTELREGVRCGCWKDFREDFANLNDQFVNVIDEVDPDDSCKIYSLQYRYGEKVFDDAGFYLPGNQALSLLGDDDKDIVNDLCYACIPLFTMLKNSVELYAATHDYVAPINIFYPGDIGGIYESLTYVLRLAVDLRPSWVLSAGANTVCFLGKTSNATKHRRLCLAYGIDAPAPRTLIEQRHVIRAVGRKSAWRCELLVFGRGWMDHKDDKRWMPFYYHMLKTAWYQQRVERNDGRVASLWRSERFSARVNAIAKSIIYIITGYSPGFATVNNREQLLPAKFIEQAYMNEYGIDYAPVLMGPAFLGNRPRDSKTVYFSNNYNTVPIEASLDHPVLSGFKELERLYALFAGMVGFKRGENGGDLTESGFRDDNSEVSFKVFYGGTVPTGKSMFLSSGDMAKYNEEVNEMLHRPYFIRNNLPVLATFLHSCIQITARWPQGIM